MKKRKISGFVIFLLVYSVILIGVIGAGLGYVWNLLIDYEAGMSDVNMERYLTEFDAEHIGGTFDKYPAETSVYETSDVMKAWFENQVAESDVSFEKLTGQYTNATPVYEVYAGEKKIARVELSEVGKNGHGFPVWEMSGVSFDGYMDILDAVNIKVPLNAQVQINGIPVKPEDLKETEEVDLAGAAGDYVEQIPGYNIYEIEGLHFEPVISVLGDNIVEVEDAQYAVCYDYGTDEALLNEVRGRITQMAHAYGTYIINKGSLSDATGFMVGKARQVLSDIPGTGFYLWNEEYTYDFQKDEITDFVRYGEDCFSCEVSYYLHVSYRGGSRNIGYDTKLQCFFVKNKGNWYLANFSLVSE
ncbi:MAG: hypothetical protein ACI4AQ_05680 [Lachnospiraceae bacterium]